MTDHLGSLARFAEVEGVMRMEGLRIQNAWVADDGDQLCALDAQYTDGDVILRPSRHMAQVAIVLHGREFLALLVWLIRQGLLENVGLVSTETAPVGATHASPVRDEDEDDDEDVEMDWDEHFQKRADEEDEPETAPPFPLPIFEMEQGAGNPEWIENRRMMVYLHHELGLSVTDIARLCNTTYAKVKVALKRLKIERMSYRGGRAKIAPPPDSE